MKKIKTNLPTSTDQKKSMIEAAKKAARKYRIENGKKFRLKNYSTNDNFELRTEDKEFAKQMLEIGVQKLSELQEILYAQDKWSLLIIFQAMDAAGKDGAIKHVMSGVNPQGCEVTSFKAPSSEEMNHDYLWRCSKNLPERGRIGIFNRSYYEEVLIVRVHEAILKSQRIPEKLVTKNIWQDRFEDIRNFESYLNRNGTVILKFFLNVSKAEQKKRFIERIDDKDKNWKFGTEDVKERLLWKQYMNAYEDLIRETSTESSPWYVVPADNKAFARTVISSAIIKTLKALDLKIPEVGPEKIAELKAARKLLMSEK